MVGEFTDLSVFTAMDGPFKADGKKCFPLNRQNKLVPLTLHQASVSQGKQGRAEAGFFFDGFTVDGGAVRATLKLIGVFMGEGEWPPPTHNSFSTLKMTDWEMGVTNVGQAIKSISCIDEGKFASMGGVTIVVTRELPPEN